MLERLKAFLLEVFPTIDPALVFGDRVTAPGLSIVYSLVGSDSDKELDGTTNFWVHTVLVQVWHNSLLEVQQVTNTLVSAMEGTCYQVDSIRPVRVDGNKRKWHQEMQITIMEDAL